VVAVAAVVEVAAAEMKTLAATAMAGVTDNNQPKLAVEEMAAETATATVTTMMMARTMTAATTTVVATSFLPDRQHTAKRGSRRNGGDNVNSDSNDNNG
jgi:hypothetical protein